ncbi:late competence protein ComER [Bacillus sp. 03113]|uniref:late competence protein ComER n=1 Tax=Bacillus sp. 03113 TaxID=2578211 RepID=UPI0011420A66|nr:late competence protein ComER [Bacillus sp. 03113]
MRVGIIGTGNMGKILIESFLDGKAVTPASLTIMNRTKWKALEIKKIYKEINIANHPIEVVKKTDLLFICVKPHDVYTVLKEISPYLTKDQCIVSITSPISVEQLESIVSCSVARAIPSITNRALAGITLLTYGKNCEEKWKKTIQNILEAISTPVEIKEEITRIASDIVSCGPAFFSYITQKFIEGAVKETQINKETATILASEMLIGFGELLKKGFYTLPSLQDKVCVKGGITGEGIKVLESGIDDVFEKVFHATNEKYQNDLIQTNKLFTLK